MAAPRAHDPVFRLNKFEHAQHVLFSTAVEVNDGFDLFCVEQLGDFLLELD